MRATRRGRRRGPTDSRRPTRASGRRARRSRAPRSRRAAAGRPGRARIEPRDPRTGRACGRGSGLGPGGISSKTCGAVEAHLGDGRADDVEDLVDVETRRPAAAERRGPQQHRPLLGLVAAAPVRGDLGDEVVGEVSDGQRDEQHHRQPLGDRRGRAGSACDAMSQPSSRPRGRASSRTRRRRGSGSRLRWPGGRARPVGRVRAHALALRERDEQDDQRVGEELHDAEQHAVAGVLAFGDGRDDVDRPERGDEQDGLEVGERARRSRAGRGRARRRAGGRAGMRPRRRPVCRRRRHPRCGWCPISPFSVRARRAARRSRPSIGIGRIPAIR